MAHKAATLYPDGTETTPGVSITCTGTDWGAAIAAGTPRIVGLTLAATSIPAPPVVTVK